MPFNTSRYSSGSSYGGTSPSRSSSTGGSVSRLSYQAPISRIDRSGVPLVNIPAANRVASTNLQGIYSSAYVSSGGSTSVARQAVTNTLTSMGVNGSTVNWH